MNGLGLGLVVALAASITARCWGARLPTSLDEISSSRSTPASAGASRPSVRARTTGTATASPISFSAALSLAGRR